MFIMDFCFDFNIFLMSKVYDWFEERLEIQAIADDVGSKYVPPHVNIVRDPDFKTQNKTSTHA